MADAEWDAIIAEYDKARETWKEEIGKFADERGKVKIGDSSPAPLPPAGRFRPRVRKYAETHAGKPEAIPALSWLVEKGFDFPGTSSGENPAGWALERLAVDHGSDPNVLSPFGSLRLATMVVGKDAVLSFLRVVAEKNADRQVQGRARLNMAEVLFDEIPTMVVSEAGTESDSLVDKKRAEDVLRAVVKDYAGSEIGTEAEALLYNIEHLQVGMTAPETVGKDVEGQEIRLSDFRGKVVMMVYWSTWCAPCMQMIPHERELVAQYEGKPFVMLGINVDDERATLRKAMKKHEITWPTVQDGSPGTGPFTSTWRVRSFPTIVLIDHKGVIRQMSPMLLQVEGMIDSLLAEALEDAD